MAVHDEHATHETSMRRRGRASHRGSGVSGATRVRRRAVVRATDQALAVIGRLRKAHGDLSFFQSGIGGEVGAPMCLKAEEMPMGPGDAWLGEIGGVPFYIDSDQYERLGKPSFEIDVAGGAADGFSLESGEGVHFVTSVVGGVAGGREA